MSEQSSEHPELKKLNSLLKNYKKSNNNKNNNIDTTDNNSTNNSTNNTTKDDQTKRNISLFRKSDKKEENRSISSEDDEGRVSSEQQPKKVQSQHPPPPRSLNTTAKNVVVMDGSDSNESSHEDEEDDNNDDNNNDNNNDTEIVNYDDQPSYHQEDQQDNFSEFSNIDFPDDLPNISSRSSTPQSTPQSTHQSIHQSQVHHQQLPSQPTSQIHHQQMPLPPQQQQQTFRVNRKSVPGKNYGISPLTVVTYNIWGNKHGQATRTVDVVNIILKGNKYVPDIVCLQEVTSKSFAILEKSLSATYHIFDVLERNNNDNNSNSNTNNQANNVPYSNVICVNRGTMEVVKDSITAYDFESQMGRKLVVCGVKHISTESTFYVLNTHLESFEENWSYRRAQLESILRLIKEEKMRNVILMGDFNITRPTEPTEVQLRLAEGYNDVWNEMGSPESLKYTYDTQTNEYARTKALQQSQQSSSQQQTKMNQSILIKGRARMDRILYKFKDQKIVPTKIRLLGVTKPQPPSDHYGLLVEFMIKKAGQ